MPLRFSRRHIGGLYTPLPPPTVPVPPFTPRFNDLVANKTTGGGGDYPDGTVWMRGGTYYVDRFDLSTSMYVRAFDASKPNNNWLHFREYDGPGTVTFNLRPESAAAALGQTQSQAYNDTAHGGGFRSVPGTAGSVRWAFDGGMNFQNGSIHGSKGSLTVFGVPGMDRIIFHGANHNFTVEEWRRQFDIIAALRGVSVVTFIPNDSPPSVGLGGSGPEPNGGPYWRVYNEDDRFKGGNQPTPFRLDGVTRFAILRADIGAAGDDAVFLGSGSDRVNVVGTVMHEIGANNGSVIGPATNWFHPDCLQITGACTNSSMLDCTYNGHLNIAAEAGDVSTFTLDRVWQGMAGATGMSLYTSGHTMGNTNQLGSGAPTTRLSGHFFKGFSNGMDHHDGGSQVFRDFINITGGTWHAVLTDYQGHSVVESNMTLAVPTGVTVDSNGFATTPLSAFLASADVPHQQFRAAYATTDLAAVMADYGISFD